MYRLEKHFDAKNTETPLAISKTSHSVIQPPELSEAPVAKKSSAGYSRDEMNLAEFPLAVLSTRVNPKIKTLEFTDQHRLPSGELAERKWIITGTDKFGLPTSTDDDVVLGLMRLSMDKGFRERKVFFTRYELLKTLRWSTEGRSYQRLIKSLDRLSGVRIRSSNSFYDNQSKSYQTCNFGIIDAYEINDERGGRNSLQAEPPKSFFIWSEVLFDSFRAGFVKKLDLDFYFKLRSAISRRLYRYLDKHFYYRSAIEVPLMTLAFEKLGLSRSYRYVSSIRQQLEPAIKELQTQGFLAGYEFFGKGALTKVRFFARRTEDSPEYISRSEQQKTRFDSKALEQNDSSAAGTKMFAKLNSRGIAEQQVYRLLKDRTTLELEKIEQILPYYDHLVATADKKVSRNPVGFLYRAVERPEQFKIPQGFIATLEEAGNTNKSIAEVSTSREYQRNPRGRPELKIFTGVRNESQARLQGEVSQELEKDYENFCKREFDRVVSEIKPEVLADIYRKVEKNTQFLSDTLGADVLEKTIEGCVKKEILDSANIPSFKQWQAKSLRGTG